MTGETPAGNQGAAPGRRRRRAGRPRVAQPAPVEPPPGPQPAAVPGPGTDAATPPRVDRPARGRRGRNGRDGGQDLERGLRELVGAGPSQLGVSGALRARDVDQPTPQEVAEAQRDVVIIRRNWQPPAG